MSPSRLPYLLLFCAVPVLAQSEPLLEAVRVQRPDARAQAEKELAACRAAKCPDQARLSLLAGVLALGQDDAATALSELPGSIDGALAPFAAFYRGEALFRAKRFPEAAAAFEKARLGPPWLAARATGREGEAWLEAGKAAQAKPLLDRAIDDEATAALIAERAQVDAALKDDAQRQADLKLLATQFAADPAGDQAFASLAAGVLENDDLLARAQALLQAGKAQPALDALARFVPANDDEAGQLALLRAQAYFALGDDPHGRDEVRLALKGPKPTAAQALFAEGKRALKVDDHRRARAAFSRLMRRFPHQPEADEAGYLRGWIDLQDHKYSDAVADFRSFARRFPRSRHGDEAQWFLSLALIEQHHNRDAYRALKALTRKYPQSSLVPQALYWTARTSQLAISRRRAIEGYQDVASRFPGSYYGWLARARLAQLKQPLPATFPTIDNLPPGPPLPGLALAEALRRAGLFKDFADEVHWQLAHSKADPLVLGRALQQLGAFGAAYRIAARSLWGDAYDDRKPGPLSLLYPRAFESAVSTWASHEGLDPAWDWAIMRRESAFRPDLTSGADARGLMQLLPVTGAEIAKAIGLPAPGPDALFEPELNVRLSSWYLAQLVKQFRHPVLCAAAYNAGPKILLKWLKHSGRLPVDLFVEQIPFKETRGYVKQVTADLLNYHALYGDPAPELSLKLPKPAIDGVGF